MKTIAELVEQDLSNPKRCFFHGTTTLGGSDACRPEMSSDGTTIIMRSMNLSHVAYRVSYSEYRKLREHPKLKIGIWEFVDENDQDAARIASATRYPHSAGRRIGDLERKIATLETATRECLGWIRHWQADVAGNLKPTPDSLAMMEAKLVAILQPVEAPEAAE